MTLGRRLDTQTRLLGTQGTPATTGRGGGSPPQPAVLQPPLLAMTNHADGTGTVILPGGVTWQRFAFRDTITKHNICSLAGSLGTPSKRLPNRARTLRKNIPPAECSGEGCPFPKKDQGQLFITDNTFSRRPATSRGSASFRRRPRWPCSLRIRGWRLSGICSCSTCVPE